jgi:acyl-CoA synthetase (AMP-forming)/AMP-acid ligase II
MNALAFSTMAMLESGGCLIVLDRFHPRTWWDSVRASRATCLHYLGVMPAMLMRAPPDDLDREHGLRFGFGAGVERGLHEVFETRFGFPLIEAWAMTETGAGAAIIANAEPRLPGLNCFGRTSPDVAARVVADDGSDVAPDTPGELLVRHAGPNPRAGFFTRYLKDPAATEEAWAGGWFHTGDIVRCDAGGNFFFVDRKKNVIRRSGENISAVEVEAVLGRHPGVRAVAVAAAPDEIRGEEVLACVVAEGTLDPGDLLDWCRERLAYYKLPGWVAFVPALPLTATQKIQRGALREMARALLAEGACVDTRALKSRAG